MFSTGQLSMGAFDTGDQLALRDRKTLDGIPRVIEIEYDQMFMYGEHNKRLKAPSIVLSIVEREEKKKL